MPGIERTRGAARVAAAAGIALVSALMATASTASTAATAATPVAAADSTGAVADGLTVEATTARLGRPPTRVWLRGAYTCGPFASGAPDRGVVDFTVTQARRGATVTGYGYLEPTVCDGTRQPFTVGITAVGDVPFRSGPATWVASGYVEGDTGLQHGGGGPATVTITSSRGRPAQAR